MLTSFTELMQGAQKGKYAVGAINFSYRQCGVAAVRAAEELGVPLILEYANAHSDYASLEEVAPQMLELARNASVPVGVHLDHGSSLEQCVKAIRLGFTSVMIDASAQSFEENVAITKEVVRVAHSVGVGVEAELGHMTSAAEGSLEGGSSSTDINDLYTQPDEAAEFARLTGVDALAICFGAQHGIYASTPVLNLDRVAEIRAKTNVALVMHGGSGVTPEDFRTAIHNGINKINYYTYMAMAGGDAAAEYVDNTRKAGGKLFFHDLALASQNAMEANAKSALAVFNGK